MRVLVAVTHLLGAGHLTRAAAVARALAAAGHGVTLMSGGASAPLVSTRGVTLVQLPPVGARVGDFATLRDAAGEPATPELLSRRRDMIGSMWRDVAPEILITELYPFGRRVLAAEFRTLVDLAHGARPRPLVAASIRDILAQPSSAAKLDATHAVLRERYDAILVHADPALVPLEASWALAPDLRPRLAYTGYVDAEPAPSGPEPDPDGSILVSGGSSAAALPLYRAALSAARRMPERPWRVLVGHGVGEADHAALAADAPGHVTLERARPDFRGLLSAAALFVGQAGYNTVVDLMRAGTPAILVPFEQGGETEQRLRAGRLAAAGLASVLPEPDLSGAALAHAVRERLASPRPARAAYRLDGAAETARILARLAAERPTS